jgi:FKBP-type peptidyl-prolyl cis-trans isomerase FkpA
VAGTSVDGCLGDHVLDFHSRRLIVVVALAAMLSPGCTEAPTAPSNYAPFTVTDLQVGQGPGAAPGNILTVHYTGWFFDAAAADQKGAQFDSSAGADPFRFFLGLGQVVPGWDQGLVGMQAGGFRRLVVPPSLAYGGTRNSVIPPYTTLVFEVQLLQIEAQP